MYSVVNKIRGESNSLSLEDSRINHLVLLGYDDGSNDTPSDEPTDPDNVEQITINTSVNNDSMGSITGAGTYNKGESVTLTAVASEGYKFLSWGDGVTDNPRTVIAEEDQVIYSAIFQAE